MLQIPVVVAEGRTCKERRYLQSFKSEMTLQCSTKSENTVSFLLQQTVTGWSLLTGHCEGHGKFSVYSLCIGFDPACVRAALFKELIHSKQKAGWKSWLESIPHNSPKWLNRFSMEVCSWLMGLKQSPWT